MITPVTQPASEFQVTGSPTAKRRAATFFMGVGSAPKAHVEAYRAHELHPVRQVRRYPARSLRAQDPATAAAIFQAVAQMSLQEDQTTPDSRFAAVIMEQAGGGIVGSEFRSALEFLQGHGRFGQGCFHLLFTGIQIPAFVAHMTPRLGIGQGGLLLDDDGPMLRKLRIELDILRHALRQIHVAEDGIHRTLGDAEGAVDAFQGVDHQAASRDRRRKGRHCPKVSCRSACMHREANADVS
ncbi:protein of unknown function [Acidithiobacillus ferrivorans]|uniref:Uncharacterized protein n=1 Tax=Acidithiobacillus ferrivorans TaxID=160808 RepID=A0ABY1MPP6_9PROT|nr:protein of unknown function [Acidithiobacillus ferrivorans]